MKLSEASEGYLLYMKVEGKSYDTVDIHKGFLKKLVQYMNDSQIEKIKESDLQRFYLWLKEDYRTAKNEKLAGASIHNAWSMLRGFSRWANEQLKIPIFFNVKMPKYENEEVPPFSQEEIKKLLSACQTKVLRKPENRKEYLSRREGHERDISIILVLLDTGIRVGELCRLKVEDVDLETGTVFIKPFGTGQKTKTRQVFISKATIKHIWQYIKINHLEGSSILFLSTEHKQLNRNSVYQILDRISKIANVQNVHPHRFRHTFAIEFLRNGGDVFSLKQILGHSTLTMVEHYLALSRADAAAAHLKASPVDKWGLK